MVWCLELIREYVSQYKGLLVCNWHTLIKDTFFILQERIINDNFINEKEQFNKFCPFCKHVTTLNSCLICSEKQYRVIFSSIHIQLVIAKSSTKHKITSKYWTHVINEIQPMLCILDRENTKRINSNITTDKKDEKTKTTFQKIKNLLITDKKDDEEDIEYKSNNVVDFLIMKIAALIKANIKFTNGLELLDRNYFLLKILKLKEPEQPIILEKCSLWTNQYNSGVLCVTNNLLLFVEAKHKGSFYITLQSIHNIQHKPDKFFDALGFFGDHPEPFYIVALSNPNITFIKVKTIWKKAVQKLIESCTRSADIQLRPKKLRRYKTSIPNLSRFSDNNITVKFGSLPDIKYTENIEDDIHPLFANPALETFMSITCKLFRNINKSKTREGILEVSHQSLHFASWDNSYVVTLPFVDIDNISVMDLTTIQIILKNTTKNIFFSLEKANGSIISQLQDSYDKSSELFQVLNKLPQDPLWDKKQLYFSKILHEPNEKTNLKNWEQYFTYYGYGSTIIRTKSLYNLILDGIPNTLRPMMWQVCSGSYYNKIIEEYPYSYYLNKANSILEKNLKEEHPYYISITEQIEYIHEIQRDIHRSFPENPYYKANSGGLQSIQNVLIAFTYRNPRLGYCQGMNMICSVLLLYMEEDEAFFLLSAIVEDIFPEYYSRSMIGSLVDAQVITELIMKYQPRIYNHMCNSIGNISLVTVPWFMCLFIHYLKWEGTLRAIDFILTEGSRALFIITLAMFHSCKDKILSTEGPQLLNYLKNQLGLSINLTDLNNYIKHYEKIIRMDDIKLLRAKHKPKILQEALGDNNSDTDSDNSDEIIKLPNLYEEDNTIDNTLQSFEDLVQKNKELDRKTMIKYKRCTPLIGIDNTSLSLTKRGRNRNTTIPNKKLPYLRRNLRIHSMLSDFEAAGQTDSDTECTNIINPKSPLYGMTSFLINDNPHFSSGT